MDETGFAYPNRLTISLLVQRGLPLSYSPKKVAKEGRPMKPCRRFLGFDGGSLVVRERRGTGVPSKIPPLRQLADRGQFWFPTRLILKSLLQRLQKGERITATAFKGD